MATVKSDQITNSSAVPSVRNNSNSKGRVERSFFSYTVPAGDQAVNDLLQLVVVPAGARLLGGFLAAEAMSTGAGAASIQIGDGTTATKYLGTTSIDAATTTKFGDTIALNHGELLTADLTLTAKVVTEAWAATKKLNGWIEYLI